MCFCRCSQERTALLWAARLMACCIFLKTSMLAGVKPLGNPGLLGQMPEGGVFSWLNQGGMEARRGAAASRLFQGGHALPRILSLHAIYNIITHTKLSKCLNWPLDELDFS